MSIALMLEQYPLSFPSKYLHGPLMQDKPRLHHLEQPKGLGINTKPIILKKILVYSIIIISLKQTQTGAFYNFQ
jgi:hypothetical protein